MKPIFVWILAIAAMFTATTIWYVTTPALKIAINILTPIAPSDRAYLFTMVWLIWNAGIIIFDVLVIIWAVTSMAKEDTETGWA